MDVRDKIDQLKNLVSDEVNETLIIGTGEKLLTSLRSEWKSDRSVFSEDDIELLQKIGRNIDAIKMFIEEQDDFPYVSTKEEVDEAVGRLYAIVEKVDGLKVSLRVGKEIRELIEKKSTLPSQVANQRSSELKRAIATLSSNSPSCKKCGSNMVLREGNGDYFWGCSTFPKCWGKKWLTKEELNVLPG